MMDDLSKLKPRRRLRPGSERELRLMRLVWLAGWRMEDIGALLGVSRATAWRRLTQYKLTADAAPGEMNRLVAAVMNDAVADGLVCGGPGEVKDTVVTYQRMVGAARVAQAAERECADKDCEQTDEDWRERALEELDRMVGVEPEYETKAAAGDAGETCGTPQRTDEDLSGCSRLSDAAAGYTGPAAGPEAHMAALGRARGGQDAGGGRMGALGGARGGVSPGGAGGAELSGGARGDDRGAERPAGDLLGDRPAGVAAFPPPA